jgi:hypothetical protein
VLHVAERLDVVDDRRALVEAEDRREIRRLDPRIGPLALERLDEPGLLAADVGAGAAVDVDLAAVAVPRMLGPTKLAARASAIALSRILAPSGNSPRM